jgi:hypothetical protein
VSTSQQFLKSTPLPEGVVHILKKGDAVGEILQDTKILLLGCGGGRSGHNNRLE